MFIILRRLFWNKLFTKLFTIWPYDVIFTLKKYFLGILGKFLQITAFYSIKTWKLSHKTIVEIVHNTQEVILKQLFSKIFTILALWRHLYSQKAFFEHFEQFLQISAFYSTITRKLPHKTMVEIVHSIQEIILKQIFPKIFHSFGSMMSSLSQNLQKFA